MVYKKLIILIFCTLVINYGLNAQVNFPMNSSFRYLKGSEAASLPSTWYSENYNDDLWSTGTAPFWYGDGIDGTQLDDMLNSYSTLYLRTTFTATRADLIPTIIADVAFDDGFIVWINGVKAFAMNEPAVPAYNAFSSDLHEYDVAEQFIVFSSDINLREGENLLAIQGFNTSLTSTDFHINISLFGARETPVFQDTTQVTFSHQSGFYSAPFTLSVETDNDTLSIYYTLDGSHPGFSPTAVLLEGGGQISVDPASAAGGGVTPGVVVRTSVVESGYKPSFPRSRSFIFLDEVLEQGHPGGIWPTYNVNGQALDFEMDKTITLGAQYGNKMEGSLLAVPTISIITDNDNLFGESEGIYVNAYGHGPEWERECSVELIYPDHIGFQTNAGLRIRGGWSRHNYFPKHAFRLFFRNEYGDGKLDYPLFEDEGVIEFDKIDLRTSMNYSWAHPGDPPKNTMLRDVFSRDLQGEMGQPYTRSRYYHLYLNGMYWGLYQTQERSEARFASSYLGDSPEDYDVVKVNTEDWNYRIEATDGNLDLWQEVYDLSEQGFSNMTNYYRLEGLNSEGKTDRSLYKLVDIDNLIDYMMIIFYTGNFDSPTSSFGGNNGCNNFFAINDRDDPTTGFIICAHDAEHSMFYEPVTAGVGIEEDRVNLNMSLSGGFSSFHPQWLHYKLTSNSEYRMRFNDRAYTYLKPGGLLTEEKCLERLNKRADQIDQAIIAESGRWGDTFHFPACSRDDNWLPDVNSIRDNFFPVRSYILEEQLKLGGLYSNVRAPVIWIDNEEVETNVLHASGSVQMRITSPESGAEIIYTLNNEDPRNLGNVSSHAIISNSEVQVDLSSTTLVRARTRKNGVWSALSEFLLSSNEEDFSKLKITEIHYHPLDSVVGTDTIPGGDFEFLEFKNTGTSTIDLSGLELDSAVRYSFPENAFLLPRNFYVIASKPVKFFERYGKIASGNYSGNLSNGGELILLKDAQGSSILNFTYDDQFPWPVYADGLGYSIVPTKASPDTYPGIAEYWVRSAKIGGSPFANDGNSDITMVEEVLAKSLRVYPNPATRMIMVDLEGADPYEELSIAIHDLNGREVFNSRAYAGEEIDLSGAGMNPGIYIVDVSAGKLSERTKLVFIGQ